MYQSLRKKKKKKIKKPKEGSDEADGDLDEEPKLIEAFHPIWNTALIFPHPWLHSGLPVVKPKICLRVDLCPRLSEALAANCIE